MSILGIIILSSLNYIFPEYIKNLSNFFYIKKIVQIKTNLPILIRIPAINISAKFEYTGITSSGEMEAPKDPAKVGWYKLGPIPGEIGSSVIAGHFGYKNNIPAVFDSLSNIKIGDKIYVEDGNKNIIIFIVKEIKNYKYIENAFHVFNSNDGLSHLSLITCGGVWDNLLKSYSNRLVVFSDREIL